MSPLAAQNRTAQFRKAQAPQLSLSRFQVKQSLITKIHEIAKGMPEKIKFLGFFTHGINHRTCHDGNSVFVIRTKGI